MDEEVKIGVVKRKREWKKKDRLNISARARAE